MMRLALVLTLVCATPAAADGFGFRTPSGNIYCNGSLQGGALIDCTIIKREAGSAPGNCPAGRELSVSLGERGGTAWSCDGPAGRQSSYSDVANYGKTAEFGRIICRSERTGFSCQNVDGHGFFLSRRSQRLF